MWGDNIGVQDEESWLDAIKGSEQLKQAGAWYEICYDNGQTEKFQASKWVEKLQDDAFRKRVLEIMDEEVIRKFDDRSGDPAEYYDDENEVEKS